jgi:hypothetical protein
MEKDLSKAAQDNAQPFPCHYVQTKTMQPPHLENGENFLRPKQQGFILYFLLTYIDIKPPLDFYTLLQ